MSYEGSPNYRWVKMYKGVRYRVTLDELGAMVWTKEATAKAANDWWKAKLASIEQPYSTARILELSARKVQLKAEIAANEATEEVLKMLPEQVHDEALARMAQVKVSGVPERRDHTLSAQAERFLNTELLRGKKPGTFGDLAYYVHKIIPELPADVTELRAAQVTDFYAWLKTQSNWSAAVQKKVFGYFRRLVHFLWSEGMIDLPRNLDKKTFDFDAGPKAIKVYPISEVREMLASLPRRLKLYALLALNCGMYGVDMGKMKRSEYQDGRITRKRTKTERTEAPTVQYLLWPETRELLDSYPPTHPEYVLTSKAGTPLWVNRIVDGKKKKYDLVGLQWHRGRGEGREYKPTITLKALRSVSATMIESHREYGRYKTHFLAHSPKSLADKNYAAPSQVLFDEIVTWLRVQILG